MRPFVSSLLILTLSSFSLAQGDAPSPWSDDRSSVAFERAERRETELEAVRGALNSNPGRPVCVLVRLTGARLPRSPSLRPYREAIESTQAELIDDLVSGLPADAFEVRYRYAHAPAMCLRIDERALAALSRNRLVETISLDAPIAGALDASREYLGVDTIHSDHNLTGAGATVAVIDTGIDTDHPDLSGDIAAGAYHFLGAGADTGPGAEDDNGHGTFVSGIITSQGTVAPKGVAPDAKILAVKVLDASNSGFVSDWIAGVDYVISVHEDYPDLVAINMSLQDFVLYDDCPCDDRTSSARTLQDLFAVARFEGIVPFVCSGNQGSCGSLTMPGCLSGGVAVGAVDVRAAEPSVASFTNQAACLELLAPGVGIRSTWIGGGTTEGSGCSYAVPFAAATAALLAESCLSAQEVVSVLTETGDSITSACQASQAPVLNSLDAVLEAQSIFLGSDADCNGNGVLDRCELDGGDCNGNGVLDSCELAAGSPDCNGNGLPDECESDCNGNGIPDECDLASGTSDDCDHDGIPDDCETAGAGNFVRGNAQGEGVSSRRPYLSVDLADGMFILQHLFADGAAPPCLDAADTNDDGRVNLVDAIHTFRYVIGYLAEIPEPYFSIDTDPTPDGLGCEQPPSLVRCP